MGKDTFDEDFEVVRSKGTLVMYGNASVGLSLYSFSSHPIPPSFPVLTSLPVVSDGRGLRVLSRSLPHFVIDKKEMN